MRIFFTGIKTRWPALAVTHLAAHASMILATKFAPAISTFTRGRAIYLATRVLTLTHETGLPASIERTEDLSHMCAKLIPSAWHHQNRVGGS